MQKKEFVVKGNELELVDGKVEISSEELAAAIQNGEVDLGAEEEADWHVRINIGCREMIK